MESYTLREVMIAAFGIVFVSKILWMRWYSRRCIRTGQRGKWILPISGLIELFILPPLLYFSTAILFLGPYGVMFLMVLLVSNGVLTLAAGVVHERREREKERGAKSV